MTAGIAQGPPVNDTVEEVLLTTLTYSAFKLVLLPVSEPGESKST